MPTRAPSAASPIAVALPMPPVPPVTRTDFAAIRRTSAMVHSYSGDLQRQPRTRPASRSSQARLGSSDPLTLRDRPPTISAQSLRSGTDRGRPPWLAAVPRLGDLGTLTLVFGSSESCPVA